jgi:peptide deformylase
MGLTIIQAGEPVLRQVSRALTAAEIVLPATQQLIEDMRETMRKAPGVGLAAPQIGLPLQLAVIEDRPEYLKDVTPESLAERERKPVPFFVLINPRIVRHSKDTAEFYEGCLSLPGLSALVQRARGVTVEYTDEHAQPKHIEARGWLARILQHEIDHLQGRLYIDHMETRSLTTLDNLNRYWKDLPIQTVRRQLGLNTR